MRSFFLNWVLTASLLTAAVLFLRAAFGRRISARLRYALWAVALARLLVPGQFFTAPVETPRVFPEVRTIQTLPGGQPFPVEVPKAPAGGKDASPVQVVPAPAGGEESSALAARNPIAPLALLGGVWLAGSAAMAAAFLVSNIRFARKLRRVRVPLEADCPLPVYTVVGLPSPCLFGALRPAVYVTPETAADTMTLRHVLIHETTHYRQGDHIWSLLRCAALAVHWWNPLVWLAAVLSRRDAELACDEGTLHILGDGERRAYGGTLLSLVTARPQPGELLRCATTMTGDKRSLRERVSRIARAPKRWLWAAVVSAVLAVLVCACSFAKTETPETAEDGPLTAEELDVFNHHAFNGDGFNMLNQFLYLAVEAPKDYRQIDLYQLFYNGTGNPVEITEEERRAVAEAGYDGEDPMVDLIKCPADEIDEILREFLGLGLEETDKVGLDRFTYLPEYDAYYDFHGDTNYPGEITFLSGERKDGTVFLYYESSGFPVLGDRDGTLVYPEETGLYCVTLEEQESGWYHFRSNWRSDQPAIPTAYPSWDPELVIPLDGLSPYQAPETQLTRRTGGVEASLWTTRFEPDEFSGDGFDVEIARSFEGDLLASVVISEAARDCFLTVPGEDSAGWTPEDSVEVFTNLFGQTGLRISYYGQLAEHSFGEISDYYTFSDGGAPSLLLRALGNVTVADLDGDGEQEITASDAWNVSQLFFRRDGTLYEADLYALIRDAWPEAGYMTHGFWDPDARYLAMSAEVPLPGTDITVSGFRTLWFDGENLRIYKDGSTYTNRIEDSIDAPADVVRQAALFVDTQFQVLAAEGYGTDGSGNYNEENFGPGNVVWDDWHVTGLTGPYYETAGPLTVEIWNVSYETHTTTPDRVILAGGSYMGEDGWCMIGYPGCDYLYFRLDDSGERTFLFSTMENDCYPGTELFLADMVSALMDQGLLTLLDLSGQELVKMMWPQSAEFLNGVAERSEAERDEILLFLAGYLSNGGEEGKTYYEGFVYELDSGYRAGELTAGGRAAWEKLQDLVSGFAEPVELEA